MNHRILATTLCALAGTLLAGAQVPGLINYQGRLTDANGAPVTGSKNFSLSIYDAATGGNLLYTESIGAVTLDANGVYSFQFGSAGTSNTQVTETIATTNGTSTTFQKVLANSPVVAGSVSVTDGTYNWIQSAGSSNEDDFGVAYSTSLRRVTANYYNGAPAAGKAITATYRYDTSGITGAISSGAEHWMAVSVDGVVQNTRQRVLAVPFAMNAKKSDTSEHAATADSATVADRANSAGSVDARANVTYVVTELSSAPGQYFGPYSLGYATTAMPASFYIVGGGTTTSNGNGGIFNIPKTAKTIRSISFTTSNKTISGTSGGNPSVSTGYSTISLRARSGEGTVSTLATQTISGQDQNITLNNIIQLDHSNHEYFIQVELGVNSTNGQVSMPTTVMASVFNLKITIDAY
jgi:hypothetical protein